MSYPTVGVHILSLPYFADRLFEYYIPRDLSKKIIRGNLVVVPFGGSNKHMNAVVFAVSEKEDISALKPIDSLNEDVSLSEEELELCLFMKEHYFCSIADAVKQMIPPEALTKLTIVYQALPPDENRTPINKNAHIVYTEILQSGGMSAEKILAKFGDDTDKILNRLCEYGYLKKCTEKKESGNKRFEEMVHLNLSADQYEETIDKIKGSRQLSILAFLQENGSTPYDVLKEKLGITHKQLENLVEKGYISIEQKDYFRNPYPINSDQTEQICLSADQEKAFRVISDLLDEKQPKAALLHGITGSGKTMVIKAAIDKVIANGQQVILLVPEIALTPQTVSTFCSFYGSRVAVIHSSLSRGERFDAWRRIKEGDVDICIGTRSAIFAPFPKLGMVVLDEEHEHTYKSDQSPKYHARDIARFRCAYHHCLMLLSSATPSVESYYKAQTGVYTLVELSKRYGDATLPETIICDLRQDANAGRISSIGSILQDALSKTLSKKEQSILFVNRRGYHNYLSCPMCGTVVTCPHCSVSLTYHAKGKQDKEGYLVCHYCGFRENVPTTCPECGSDQFNFMGFGTQKAEADIQSLFSDTSIIRLDADTASGKFATDKILSAFKEQEADILIGTQMVTKGHNFPNVTLVGILLADTSLYISDYRAGERTFALITQVIGRAGRGEKKGVAVIQTYSPDNPVLLQAAAQNYKDFYENEISMRKALLFPPFCDIALITLTCSDEALLTNTAVNFSSRISELAEIEFKGVSLIVFGPFEAPIYKVNDIYRLRYIIKCRSNQKTRTLFSKLLSEFTQSGGKKVSVSIDINPSSI